MRDDLVKICNCGCMYKEDECPNCNKLTDVDRIAELEDKLKIAEAEVKHLKSEVKYTLYGDLDGMSVAELRSMLAKYPDDARIDVRSRPTHSALVDEDFFVIEAAK